MYKTGATYAKLYDDGSNPYDYNASDDIVITAEESCSGVRAYHLISNGKIIFSWYEDDTKEGKYSLIDILYALKYGNENPEDVNRLNLPIKIFNDVNNDEIDLIFREHKVPERFLKETIK